MFTPLSAWTRDPDCHGGVPLYEETVLENMKRFKSISVDEATFDEIERLTKILLPKVKLSKAQVVKSLIEVGLKSIINLSKEKGKNETQ